jgi:hypothetical protein
MPKSVSPHGSRSELLASWLTPDEAAGIRALAYEGDRSVSSEVRRAVRRHLAALKGNGSAGHGPEATTRRAGTRDYDQA